MWNRIKRIRKAKRFVDGGHGDLLDILYMFRIDKSVVALYGYWLHAANGYIIRMGDIFVDSNCETQVGCTCIGHSGGNNIVFLETSLCMCLSDNLHKDMERAVLGMF